MSLVMHLYYTGKNGSARKFVKEMEESGTAERIRREPGNICYDYFVSVSDPETVLLVDEWDSQKALDDHHASVMMETLSQLREKYDLHMYAERLVSAENPIEDQSFIRK